MKLNFKHLGSPDAPPLVILHGLFGMLDNWQTLGRQLSEHFQVFLIDQRNHGKSPHDTIHTYPAMADDLFDFAENQGITSFHLIGHSMGGKAAMQFAVEYPDYLDKLVIVDIAPKDYPPGHNEIFRGLFAVDLAQVQSRKEAGMAMAIAVKTPAIRQFLLKNLSRTKTGNYVWKCNLDVLHQAYPTTINNSLTPYDSYEGKVLFVKGEKSERYIELPDDEELIEHFFPNYQVKTIADAGHWIHAEQPKAFFKVTLDFLLNTAN